VIRDLRHAARTLARSPGFAVAAALTLAIGIGANTAMFSVFNAMLLRPLPYPHRDRLVQIWATNPGNGWTRAPVSPLDFLDWREQNKSFERMTAARFWFYTLAGEGDPEQLHGMRVSPGFFEALGVKPAWGRTFLPEEEQRGRDRAVILTHGLWQRRFSADPALIGKTVSIDAEPYTVAGILPRDFWFYPILGKDVELWMPLAFETSELKRDARSILVHGLLKPDVSIDRARAEMASIADRLEHQYPTENKGWRTRIEPGINSKDDIRPKVLLLFGAVGFVLLIACANVANLTLARDLRRQREIALRSALGAGRLVLVRQLLLESAVVGGVGCVGGLLLGVFWLRLLVRFWSPRFEAFLYGGLDTLRLDRSALAFSVMATLLSIVIAGLIPAKQASRPNLGEALKAGERGSGSSVKGRRLRDVLMLSQVALALMLSVGAGLMIRSLGTLQRLDRGLKTEGVLTAQVWPHEMTYVKPHDLASLHRRIVERLETLPGVSSAGAISFLPLSEMGIGSSFSIEGRPAPSMETRPNASYSVVTPRYLQTMQIQLVRGRYLTDADSADAPAVAVIDQKLAQRYWPGEDPIGKRFAFEALDAESPWHADLTTRSITVVGIVAAIRGDGLWEDSAPVMYLPYQQNPSRIMHLVVRTEGDPRVLANAVQRAVWEVDPDQPLSFVRPMDEVPAWALSDRRLTLQLLAIFASLAILLAATGIYGVIAFAVSQRRQEIGIRMALGAQRRKVTGMIVAQGLKVILAGVVLGVAAAVALTRFLSSQLYGVTTTDAGTFCVASVLLMLVAASACYLPARRASRIDPTAALRQE
jgi:putative ABC transport system permease protein